jgi:hypothetical protein
MLKQPTSLFVITAGRLFKYSVFLLMGFVLACTLADAVGARAIAAGFVMAVGPWVCWALLAMVGLMFLCVVAESLR